MNNFHLVDVTITVDNLFDEGNSLLFGESSFFLYQFLKITTLAQLHNDENHPIPHMLRQNLHDIVFSF